MMQHISAPGRLVSGRSRLVALVIAVTIALAVQMLSAASPAAAFVPPDNDYVYYNPYYRTGDVNITAHFNQYGTTYTCKYSADSPGLVDQSGDLMGASCAAQDIAAGNYGYTSYAYRYVNIYYGAWYSGAWACIYPGYYWEMGGIFTGIQNYGQLTFNHGQTVSGARQGYGQSIWFNVRSLQWETHC